MTNPRINVYNETMTRAILVSGEEIEYMTFPAGEPFVKLDQLIDADLYNRKIVVDARISQFSDMGHLHGLTEILVSRGAILDTLLIPYFPGSRGDRDVPFNAKMYAEMFKALGYRRIVTLDPHSEVCVALSGAQKFHWRPGVSGKYSHLVIPDGGAAGRAHAWQQWFNVSKTVQVLKHRDMRTGALSGFSVEAIGDNLHHKGILVDDICDGGGTFLGAATAVRERYPHMALDLFVTHGLFSKGTEELLKAYGRIYSSTSMHTADELIDMGVTPIKVFSNELDR